ncbi:MAG TPA: MFS transporter [Jatrophihabitans sp.]|nr:MFS transporter [Jatrophihabitans sp.]
MSSSRPDDAQPAVTTVAPVAEASQATVGGHPVAAATPDRNLATLAVISIAQFIIALDYSIIYIALPSIATDLHLKTSLAQWVVSAYAVLFAGFLVVGGRLADRIGPKQLFVIAIVLFGLASAVGGLAQDGAVLLAARGTQGLGAALLQPAVLGLIGITFPAGPARSRALAVWGSVGASGLAAGAILGGLLTAASWRLTFEINVPLTLLCALGTAIWVRSAIDRSAAKQVPVLASMLGTGTVLSLVLALTLSASEGWTHPATLTCYVLAIALFTAFLRNERRSATVLIEPVLRGVRSLRIGAGATAFYMASVGSEFYLLTLLLQSRKGYSALEAGFAFLPLAVMVTAGSTSAGRAVRRFAPAAVLMGGFTVAAVGLVWLVLTLQGGSYALALLPGLLLSGFGHGVIYTSMFIIGTHDVPVEHQGTSGALLTTSQYLSGALTVAILTLVLGTDASYARFRWAFGIITAAAAAGIVLIGARRRSLGAGPVQAG